ncbi:amino acid ABC transporter membrane protein, PAAT family [Desulfonauticus submarinus]|uniref:Glutamate/aspartate import permease protein GltK n=1 Tax=Desulfonauticus submarinus TaxID=206665 RepID=A0A1H0A679_9BACT|nr:amino acid ABC transporter membrane protein, PAAT family [Desulfonauticus submarinus]
MNTKKINTKLKNRVFKTLFFCFLFSICFNHQQVLANLYKQGEQALTLGNLQKAENILHQIPPFIQNKKNPDFLKARLLLARLYYNQQNYKLAKKECLSILRYFPKNKEANQLLKTIDELSTPVIINFFRDTYKYLPALLKGTLMTLILVLFTMLVSPFGGLIIALGRISKFYPLNITCWFIIWLFRGTPLLLQLFFIYYGLPALGITLKPLTAAFWGLGLNYSAYLAEIIRAGIQSIDAGQMEAAKALGMTYSQAMRRIIIPQTYKRIMPPIGNEFIALIKDTALVSTIAMVELMRSADQLFNTYFDVKILILAGIIYLLLTTIFTLTFEKIERKVGAYEKR